MTPFRARRLASIVLLAAAVPAVSGAVTDTAALLQQIRQLEWSGQRQAALPLYRQLLAAAPEDSALVHELARALNASGLFEEQEKLLADWLRRHPDDSLASLHLGAAQLGGGRIREAVTTWSAALARVGAEPRLYEWVSERCLEAGLTQEAIRFLESGRRRLGPPELFAWELAQLHAQVGAVSEAVAAYVRSLRAQPQRAAAIQDRLLALASDPQRREEVLAALDRSLAETLATPGDPATPPLALAAALCWLDLGDPEKGLERLERAGGPAAAMLLTYAGRCEAQGHGGPAARAYALFAAAQAPGALRASALLRQAALIAAAGDRKRAMAIYAQVAREVPHSAASREALVRAARLGAGDQQGIDAARLSLQQVLAARQRDEWDTAARELLVDIEIRANDLPAAERHLDELRAAGAGSFPWGYRRAELLFYQGRLPEAARLLDSLATAAPGHALANDALELLLACEALAADSLSREAFVAGALAERQGDPVRAQPAWTWIAAHASPAVAQLALREQARARWVAGDDEATVELCTRLATAYPSGPFRVAAQLLAAQALARAGKVHEALEQLESALLAAPEDPQAPAARLQIEALRQRLATPRAAAPRGAVGLPQ